MIYLINEFDSYWTGAILDKLQKMICMTICRRYTCAKVLQFRTCEKRYASQVYSCRSLIGLSYYAGCILLLKCNFIDCERSININSCFMRKIIPARIRASAFFYISAVRAAGSKHKHTTGLSRRCICVRFQADDTWLPLT